MGLFARTFLDYAPESREQMHMILHAANENGPAIELFRDAAEVRVQRVTRGFVAQKRTAVLVEKTR